MWCETVCGVVFPKKSMFSCCGRFSLVLLTSAFCLPSTTRLTTGAFFCTFSAFTPRTSSFLNGTRSGISLFSDMYF